MQRFNSYLLLSCLVAVAIYLVFVNDTSTPSDKEHIVASDKLTLDQTLELVQAEVDLFPHLYAGIELEGENIVLYATNPALADNNAHPNLTSSDHVIIKPVKYSQTQLHEAQQIVLSHLSDQIVASYTDMKNNQVVIIVSNKTQEIVDKVTELIHKTDIVSIVEGEVELKDQVALN